MSSVISAMLGALAGWVLIAGIPATANGNQRPNFIVIQTDDQTRQSVVGKVNLGNGRGPTPIMPRVRELLVERGANWNNFYTPSPICSPSRASLLSGQLAHNNRVAYNNVTEGWLNGGWPGWKGSPSYSDNFVTRLQQSGYRTAHFGKFFNHYYARQSKLVPVGWSTWFTDATDDSTRDFYGYFQLEKKGRLRPRFRGPIGSRNYQQFKNIDRRECSLDRLRQPGCNYHSDRISRLAVQEINRSRRQPFYIQLDYHTWHGDKVVPSGAQPATRHQGMADRATLPDSASWNEADISDKPAIVRRPRLNEAQKNSVRSYFRRGVEALRAVDEGLGAMVQALKRRGQLNNTYIIYLSDNGIFLGSHRFALGKGLAYEDSARMPLLIRGPGITPGRNVSAPAATTDIAPSILSWAGVSANGLNFDGPTLQEGLSGAVSPWRPLWISSMNPEEDPESAAERQGRTNALRYRAVLVGPYKYVDFYGRGEELYDLRYDPQELDNQVSNPNYSQLLSWMSQMEELGRGCSGIRCYPQLTPPTPGPWSRYLGASGRASGQTEAKIISPQRWDSEVLRSSKPDSRGVGKR